MRALLVGGSPESSSPSLVASLAGGGAATDGLGSEGLPCDLVVAVDRGVSACRAAGVVPDVLVGDADSAPRDDLAWARSLGTEELRFDPEKDDTDLGLALSCVRNRGRGQDVVGVTLVCVSGGRPDHQLAVFGLLATNADLAPVVVEDDFECHVLSPVGQPCWQVGRASAALSSARSTFSAIALAPGTRVTERSMRWELDAADLPLLGDLGVSNRVAGSDALVRCDAGVVAAFLRA